MVNTPGTNTEVLTTELVKTTEINKYGLTTGLVKNPVTNTEVLTTELVKTTGITNEVLTTELVKTTGTNTEVLTSKSHENLKFVNFLYNLGIFP